MNLRFPPLRTLGVCSSVLLLPLHLVGQAVSAPADGARPPADAKSEVLNLSPFEVRSQRDTSYSVENAVATTGIAQSLTQTPLSISVVTDQFLRDTGRSGFREALGYTGSLTFDNNAADGRNPPGLGLSQPNYTRSRGQAFGATQRNGLNLGVDTENVDRIEIARGPMAVFIGGSNLGGVVNVITKKPQFARTGELTARVDDNGRFASTLDFNDTVSRSLAYRLTASYADGPTWRDHSDSSKVFLDAQLLWQPGDRYQGRFEFVDRQMEGNLVGYNVSSSENYARDYNQPSQALLDLGRRRTTGAAAGQPFTVPEYRARIGRAFASWRQDVYDATGVWRSLGEGEFITPGNFPSGLRANHYGPHSPFEDDLRFAETEHQFRAADWLSLRVVGRAAETSVSHLNYAFNPRIFPDGSTPLLFGNSARREGESLSGKIEAVARQKWPWVSTTLLVGEQGETTKSSLENGVWDANSVVPQPGSPNVVGTPALLTGRAVYDFFDPRVHPFPDHRLAQRWAGAVTPAGVASINRNASHQFATYGALGLGFFEDRLMVTGGARRVSDHSKAFRVDRDQQQVGGATFDRQSTNSYMGGFSVRLFRGVHAYASYNQGSSAVAGSLVGAYNSLAPVNIVPLEEAAAHRAPNLLGKGKEAGFKFETAGRKLSGSIGWFELVNANILVTDTSKTSADPRNVGTEVDPNSATVNSAIQPRVRWSMPVEGDISSGFEADLTWAPIRELNVILSAVHLTENRITVNPPVSSNPITMRDYLLLNGRPLNNTPDNMVRLWGQYRFAQTALRGLGLGAGVRYQSESMPGSATDLNWGLINPSFTVFDVALSYETKIARRSTTFQVFINNATDKLYSDGGRSYSPPREFALAVRLSL
jgi:outer membrane receptor protein involved in Fe transport